MMVTGRIYDKIRWLSTGRKWTFPKSKTKKTRHEDTKTRRFHKVLLGFVLTQSVVEKNFLRLERRSLRESFVSLCLCGYLLFFVLGNLQDENEAALPAIVATLECESAFRGI